MKKALIGTCMLAVACMLCAPAFAVAGVPHSPITAGTQCSNYASGVYSAVSTPYGAPATATVAGSIPIFSLLPTLDNPVTSWPAPGAYDFCAAFDTAACSLGTLSGLSSDILTYMTLFFCSTDINGPVNLDPQAPLPITANGIPDGEFELGLLAGILNNTANPNNAAITSAFQANYNYFRKMVNTALSNVPLKLDARGLIVGTAGPYLHTSLTMILAGYATEGDSETIAALDALVGALSAIGIVGPPGGIGSVTTGFPAILGPNGDADHDGFTNRAEYNYFQKTLNSGSVATIAAELDANTTPPATVPKVEILGAGTVEEGAALDLRAVVLNTEAASYAWSKNGSPLTGETASSLVIPVLALSDSGSYVCTITTSVKTAGDLVSSNPVVVNVVPAGSLPIAGGLGLALLAGACALGGVGSIRRRK